MAQRRPVLHKVLDHNDEFFALLMLVLEAHSLQTRDASFSESLYGLRRRPVEIIQQRQEANSANGHELKSSGLRRHQRVLSVVFLVALPYFKSKLESLYKAQRGAMLQAALWGRGDSNMFEGDSFSDNVEDTSTISELQEQDTTRSNQIVKKMKAFLASCYPWIHATQEGLSFTYQLLYLLDATGFYSPALHAMCVHVCRATGQELMDASSRNAGSRFHESERVHGTPWLQTFRGLLLRSLFTSLDYAQNGLIAAVFLFKMMEWWYQSAEERLSSPTVYPPPPPPPQPKVAENGIPLPPDRTVCPLCSQRRTNPTLIAVSGFVFCYPCIFNYVSKYNRCPVTLMPASVDQLRRLFHDA
ncbi:peroxisome biogenesis protein 12 isoform X2 [Cryptomeria japonica]|nr:peroxisome biogenesis protein 12 isoform X2 [Cryptomeria japonica]XP_057863213.1 peroxisome biogenesis protein 12 isoform X2 [Cryptomeria japonica]